VKIGGYALGALFLALVIGELVAITVCLVRDHGYLTVRQELERESSTFLHTHKGCVYVDELFPHPYLGFVFNKNPPCTNPDANKSGMLGPDFPTERMGNKFVILLSGGSAAAQLFELTRGGLEEELNKNYALPGREFLVLDGAVYAWKEPQQLILFLMHTDVLDGIVTLDGYNEFDIPRELHSGFDMPLPESVLATNPAYDAASLDMLELAHASNSIYESLRSHWLWSRSKLAYLVGSALRNRQRAQAERLSRPHRKRAMTLDTLFDGHSIYDDQELLRRSFAAYSRYLKTIDAVANRFDIKAAHFLQPIAAWGKPLTPQERRIADDSSVGQAYHDFVTPLLALRAEGSQIFSLLDLYNGWKSRLYIDAVHQQPDSPGYRLMAQRIAETLGEAWHLPRRSAPAAR
jgi:hypothetical protein